MEKDEVMERWAEYVEELYKDGNRGVDDIIDMGQMENEVYTICSEEIEAVIRDLPKGKACGSHNVSAELLHCMGERSGMLSLETRSRSRDRSRPHFHGLGLGLGLVGTGLGLGLGLVGSGLGLGLVGLGLGLARSGLASRPRPRSLQKSALARNVGRLGIGLHLASKQQQGCCRRKFSIFNPYHILN